MSIASWVPWLRKRMDKRALDRQADAEYEAWLTQYEAWLTAQEAKESEQKEPSAEFNDGVK
jgi:hypothetical protein